MSSRMMIGLNVKSQLGSSPMDKMMGSSLRILSTVQLTRFALMDISQIMNGTGGIGDGLSLMTNLILLTFRYSQLLDTALLKQMALNTIGFLAPFAPIAGAVAIAGLVSAPIMMYSSELNKEREATYQELAWRSVT